MTEEDMYEIQKIVKSIEGVSYVHNHGSGKYQAVLRQGLSYHENVSASMNVGSYLHSMGFLHRYNDFSVDYIIPEEEQNES